MDIHAIVRTVCRAAVLAMSVWFILPGCPEAVAQQRELISVGDYQRGSRPKPNDRLTSQSDQDTYNGMSEQSNYEEKADSSYADSSGEPDLGVNGSNFSSPGFIELAPSTLFSQEFAPPVSQPPRQDYAAIEQAYMDAVAPPPVQQSALQGMFNPGYFVSGTSYAGARFGTNVYMGTSGARGFSSRMASFRMASSGRRSGGCRR